MQNMLLLLLTLLSTPHCMGYSLGILRWNEDRKVVCSGKDFQVPVFSRSRIVTFTPSSPPEPKRVLLENNIVKDPRYEWTRDQTLLLREVTRRDQGVYAVKFSHGFTIETVELVVSECIRKLHKTYGETFKLDIPPDGASLELNPLSPLSFLSSIPSQSPSPSPSFSSSPSPSSTLPLFLSSSPSSSTSLPPSLSSSHTTSPSQNHSSSSSPSPPFSSSSKTPSPSSFPSSSTSPSSFPSSSPSPPPSPSSPSLSSSISPLSPFPTLPLVLWTDSRPSERTWGRGRVKDRSWLVDEVTLADQGNYTIKDSDGKVVSRASLTVTAHWSNITAFNKEPLYIRVYTPLREAQLRLVPDHPSSRSRSATTLLQDGQIVEEAPWHRGRLSLEQNRTGLYFVMAGVSEKDNGIYEMRDGQGNLVSTNIVRVVDKHVRWRAVIKSISVPSGMFASLAGLILFLKRYPSCSVAKILRGLRDRRNATTAGVPPRVHIEDYSEPNLTSFTSSPYKIRSSKQWSPSPSRSGYSPVVQRAFGDSPEPARATEMLGTDPSQNLLSQESGSVRKTSFSLVGASDCLHSSEHCAQFDLGRFNRNKDAKDYFSTLPLDMDTSDICSVYTSDKLNFL
ncbi:uncharacterized protein LOC134096185 [Sardina pilchardus]|uniref:uncharacterized protein LOC134096185 n=1 Tax=Sardina pilchardus TaxID=27697 RepID=UPI002E1357D9